MVQRANSDPVEPSNPDSGAIYVCRAAIAVIRLDGEGTRRLPDPELRGLATQVAAEFTAALSADPRVAAVTAPSSRREVDNAGVTMIFEPDHDGELLSAGAHFSALRLNEVLEFSVRVPRKNQPLYRSLDDVPADEYQVLWDGIAVYVQWRQESHAASGSGGHVVLDVLQAAGSAAGHTVQVIACAPGCKHRFLHADFVTFPSGCDGAKQVHAHGQTPVGISAAMPIDGNFDDPRENLRDTFGVLHRVLGAFVDTKSSVDEVRYFEGAIESTTRELLEISYRRAARSSLTHPVRWWRDLWALRGSTRAARRLTAASWLALARLSSATALWRHYSGEFVSEASKVCDEAVLETFDAGIDEIERIDPSIARDAVAEVSSRREGRMLITATAAGAAAAALGGAVGSLLS